MASLLLSEARDKSPFAHVLSAWATPAWGDALTHGAMQATAVYQPDGDPTHARSNSARSTVPIMETTIDPRQPSRFENRTNIPA